MKIENLLVCKANTLYTNYFENNGVIDQCPVLLSRIALERISDYYAIKYYAIKPTSDTAVLQSIAAKRVENGIYGGIVNKALPFDDEISHRIEKVWLENDSLFVNIVTLETPSGLWLENAINEGIAFRPQLQGYSVTTEGWSLKHSMKICTLYYNQEISIYIENSPKYRSIDSPWRAE